jgi:hypothetical protein
VSEEKETPEEALARLAERAREHAAQMPDQGKTQASTAIWVLHLPGKIYIGQSGPAGPEPEAGQ